MKILHFTTSIAAGGAETMLCNLVEQHRALGIESVVVTSTSECNGNSLVPRLAKSSQFIELRASSLASIPFGKQFCHLLKSTKPDLVQTWMHTSGPAISFLTKLHAKIPVVWGIHSKEFLRYPNAPILRSTLGRLLGVSAHLLPSSIISCSQAALELHVKNYGYPKHKMHWIGNGIDTSRFVPNQTTRSAGREHLGITPNCPLIGMMSRAAPVKDIPTFLRAAAIIQAKREDIHLAVCGFAKEELDAEATSILQTLPAPQRLHWLGFQRQPETIFPLFDLHTLTSQSEAFPMALIEAMACGVPNVSTRVGDAQYIIGPHGTVVPPGQPEALARAWDNYFTRSSDARRELSSKARQYAVQNFSLKQCAQRYHEIYQGLATSF